MGSLNPQRKIQLILSIMHSLNRSVIRVPMCHYKWPRDRENKNQIWALPPQELGVRAGSRAQHLPSQDHSMAPHADRSCRQGKP